MSNVTVTLTDAQYSQLILLVGAAKQSMTDSIDELGARMPCLTRSEAGDMAALIAERKNAEALMQALAKGTTLG